MNLKDRIYGGGGMSEDLKPCPLCGEIPYTTNISTWCVNNNCSLYDNVISATIWNTRPIEDALQRQLNQANDSIASAESWQNQDCLCCPLADEPTCDEICDSQATLIKRIAEDRVELARKENTIKHLEHLLTPDARVRWVYARKISAARARRAEVRGGRTGNA